jgi:hypothetical protein
MLQRGQTKLHNKEKPMHEATKMLVAALERAGVTKEDDLITTAEKLCLHLTPQVVEVERTDKMLVVEITSSVDASLFDGITCGNQHLGSYTFPDGKMSGLTRIGHCDHIVSSLFPGAALIRISKVSLTRLVPVGETVCIRLEYVEEELVHGHTMLRSALSGIMKKTGKAIFEPCTVLTYQP